MRNCFQSICSLFRFFLLYCLQKIPKRINNLIPIRFLYPFFWLVVSILYMQLIWCRRCFPDLFVASLFFNYFFFGNDRCICRINRLHHLTVHQINLCLKICVSNTTFHNDWYSFQSSTLPFCCVLCTQGLWTFILSILTHDRTLRSQLLANYVSIP